MSKKAVITEINASKERTKFYESLGIFAGAEIEIFLNGKGLIIYVGSTKIGLCGKALDEIRFEEVRYEKNNSRR